MVRRITAGGTRSPVTRHRQFIDSRDSSSRCVHRDNGEAEEQTLDISPSRQDARIGIDYSQRYKTLAAEDDP